MKKSDFIKAMEKCGTGKSNRLPVLKYFCVKNGLVVKTDLEQFFLTQEEINIPAGYYSCSTIEELQSIIKVEEGNAINSIGLKFSYLPLEDFPNFKHFFINKNVISLEIPQFDKKWIQYAISDDMDRQVLNGVAIFPNGDMVSTNGFRLHLEKEKFSDFSAAKSERVDVDKEWAIIIPTGVVKLLDKASKLELLITETENEDEKNPGKKIITKNIISARLIFLDGILHFRLIEGKFPDPWQIIPTNLPYKIGVGDIKQAIEFIDKLKIKDKEGIKIFLKRSFVRFTDINGIQEIQFPRIRLWPEEEVEDICFNYYYLKDVMEGFDNNAIFEYTTAIDLCKISKEGKIAVVMPMRL
jgi:DNA polymerase III sliding clamp (beta) subunit (PCNA family)